MHDYLGMYLDYSDNGRVKISMIKYIKKILNEFSEEIKSKAESLAAEHLF